MRDGTTPGNLPVLQLQLKLETKDFFDFAHGQPLGWHSVPPRNNREENLPADCPTHASLRKVSGIVSTHSGILSTCSAQVKRWTTSRRNPWTTSSGIGGQLRPESVDNLPRNTQLGIFKPL